MEAAVESALRAALTAAGVDVSKAAVILTEMQIIMDMPALATAVATDGLAALLETGAFDSILADAGLDGSAVAAIAAAATAAEVDADNSNGGDEDAAPAAKSNAGVIVGSIIAVIGVVLLLVGGVQIYRKGHGDKDDGVGLVGGNAGGIEEGSALNLRASASATEVRRPSAVQVRRPSDNAGYDGISLGRRPSRPSMSLEATSFQNPVYDGGDGGDGKHERDGWL